VASASNVTASGAPVAITNITITSSTAVAINSNAVNGGGTVTNAYGLYALAPTGATNNYAAVLLGGNVGVGSSSPAYTFSVNGTAGFAGLSSSGVGDVYVCLSAQNELRTGATCAASTKTIKENITPFYGALDIVKQLQIFNFKYKKGYYGSKEAIGPMAEDVAKIDPRLAYFDGGKPYAIDWNSLNSIGLNAILEQQAQIEILSEQVNRVASEDKLENLQKQIDTLKEVNKHLISQRNQPIESKEYNFAWVGILGLLGLIPLIKKRS